MAFLHRVAMAARKKAATRIQARVRGRLSRQAPWRDETVGTPVVRMKGKAKKRKEAIKKRQERAKRKAQPEPEPEPEPTPEPTPEPAGSERQRRRQVDCPFGAVAAVKLELPPLQLRPEAGSQGESPLRGPTPTSNW